MEDYVKERVIEVVNYIIDSKATIRETAKVFNVSKTTIHNDVTIRILKAKPDLRKAVKEVLDQNLQERAIRGGMATKLKYQKCALKRYRKIKK